MFFSISHRISFALLVAFTLLSTFGCRHAAQPRPREDEALAESEPESYSATIIRTVDDGSVRHESVTRIARSGEMRREEWSEQGRKLALISRPDMGKMFLLDLDKQAYVEFAFGAVAARETETKSSNPKSMPRDDESRADPAELERALDSAPLPASVTTLALMDQTIENHPCRVFERRASFPGGHVEITRVFRALDLQGLAIRIESESEGGVKVITERRNVNTSVSPEEFIVPPAFEKVAKLSH